MLGNARAAEQTSKNVTSPKRGALTPAERKARQRAREVARQAEALKYTSDEWRDFVDPAGLQRKAGASWDELAALVLKELADNAADAGGGAIERTEHYGPCWTIADVGPGIAPDDVARVFSVTRAMQSTKHVRMPRRGSLGNGTRVISAFCAIERLQLRVLSRDVMTILAFDTVTGRTEIVSQAPAPSRGATLIYIPRTGGLAEDGADHLARRTLALGDPMPGAISYAGSSSPWWYGASDLLKLLATAPAGASIADVVRDMGLALPRDVPNGVAAAATLVQTTALLTALCKRYEPVPVTRIGRIGRLAFGIGYQGYAVETVTRKDRSGAEVPVMIEVFAGCYGWKRRDMTRTASVQT